MKPVRWIAAAVAGIAVLLVPGCGGGLKVDPQARAAFDAAEGPVSLAVFPVRVVRGEGEIAQDAALALRLVDALNASGHAEATLAAAPMEFEVEWGMNQAKMFLASADAFASRVAEVGIRQDYALVVEILANEGEDWIGGVHYYLVDSGGRIVAGGLSNSHHDVFKNVDPKSREDGYRVGEAMLLDNWGTESF